VRVADGDVARHAEGERIVVDGEVIPFLSLSRVLQRARREAGGMQSAVVLEVEGQRAAVGVDRLGGARSIVVRAIPEHAAVDPVVSGATFDDDGVPQLVLAPAMLVREASIARPVDDRPLPALPAPILVIDDSLTTRMLEQSILESAGYEVDLAVSGEEALEMARGRRYGLFIVDVEMPGMSGFDFIATIARDPTLGEVPAILVTSCADPDDKRRGMEVGAHAYIVKSEFDQATLLEIVRRFVR
jgi:two-component system chemotaxis sensor kinase CheA